MTLMFHPSEDAQAMETELHRVYKAVRFTDEASKLTELFARLDVWDVMVMAKALHALHYDKPMQLIYSETAI